MGLDIQTVKPHTRTNRKTANKRKTKMCPICLTIQNRIGANLHNVHCPNADRDITPDFTPNANDWKVLKHG
jgi:hypothetical protein